MVEITLSVRDAASSNSSSGVWSDTSYLLSHILGCRAIKMVCERVSTIADLEQIRIEKTFKSTQYRSLIV